MQWQSDLLGIGLQLVSADSPAHHYVEPARTVFHDAEHLLVVGAREERLIDLDVLADPLRESTDSL